MSIALIQAIRPKTLPLAAACITIGASMAVETGHFKAELYLLCLVTAFLLQILSNLANDYGDYKNGIDGEIRTDRALASGKMSLKEMHIYLFVAISVSLITGVWLLYRASEFSNIQFWPMLLLGLISILAAMFYTIGKKPYGYLALGDLSVLIFFGFVAVGGTYYIQSGTLISELIFPALGVGLLSVGVLNVNNIRDIENDIKSKKRTLANMLGYRSALNYHVLLIVGAFVCLCIYTFQYSQLRGIACIVACFPLAIHINRMFKIDSGDRMGYNGQLKLLSLNSLGIAIIIFLTTWF